MGIDKFEASVGLAKAVKVLLEGSDDFRMKWWSSRSRGAQGFIQDPCWRSVGHDLASDLVTTAEASPPAVLQPDVRHVSDHVSLKLVLQPS